MKSLVFLLLIIGIIFIAVGYIRSNQKCPPRQIEYRYLPKTFIDEQNNRTPVLSIFGSMFSKSSPWQDYVGYTSNFDNDNTTQSNASSSSASPSNSN